MRVGSGVVLVLLLASLAVAVAPAGRVRGDTNPPDVSERTWSPLHAIAPENVTIHARVTDEDGIQLVEAIWCYVPPWLCQYSLMYDDGTNGDVTPGDGLYSAIVQTHESVEGASYKIHAVDVPGNQITTEPIYAMFATLIAVTLEKSALAAEPGGSVAVNGTAFYGNDADPGFDVHNETAPAEGAIVTVSAGTSNMQATVDAIGHFSATLTAPGSEGTFALTASALERTLTGSADGTLAVSIVPRPDLLVGDPRPSTSSPIAGQPMTITFDIRNVGSADAVDVLVVVEVQREAQWVRIYAQRITVARGGGSTTLAAEWTPTEGSQSVRIRVDPDGELEEINEEDGIALMSVSARPADLPLLWIGLGGAIVAVGAVATVVAVRRRRSS